MINNLEAIRARADIVEVIGSFVPLKQQGRNFVVCCPFHGEKTPSLVVNDSRNLWHCFGCGAGGDIFKFVSEFEKCDFTTAVEKVAALCGGEVEKSRENGELKGVFEFYEALNEWFKSNLRQNKALQEYLFKRGLQKEDFKSFNIGFCPPNNEVLAWLKKKNYTALAQKLGVLKKSFCLFAGRITFAFLQENKIIGFSGRVTPDFKPYSDFVPPKYINSSESAVFKKSEFLYNFTQERKNIATLGECFVCEGFFDAIALSKLGVKGAVATCGTAFSEGHLKKFARLNARLNFVFDNDTAGFEAARKAGNLAYNAGFFDARVGVFKREFRRKKDAGEILKEFAGVKVERKLDANKLYDFYSVFEFVARRELKLAKNTREAQNALNAAKQRLANCKEELFRAQFEKELEAVFAVKPNTPPLTAAKNLSKPNLVLTKMVKSLLNLPRENLKSILEFYSFAFCGSFAASLSEFVKTGELDKKLRALELDARVGVVFDESLAALLRFFYCKWCEEQIALASAKKDFDLVVSLSQKLERANGD